MQRANEGRCKTPDNLFRECLDLVEVAKRHASSALAGRQRCRRILYRLARKYLGLARHNHNWLMGQAARVGGIDALLDQWFAPLELFGENYRDLLADVSNGMSERQFLASGARW